MYVAGRKKRFFRGIGPNPRASKREHNYSKCQPIPGDFTFSQSMPGVSSILKRERRDSNFNYYFIYLGATRASATYALRKFPGSVPTPTSGRRHPLRRLNSLFAECYVTRQPIDHAAVHGPTKDTEIDESEKKIGKSLYLIKHQRR